MSSYEKVLAAGQGKGEGSEREAVPPGPVDVYLEACPAYDGPGGCVEQAVGGMLAAMEFFPAAGSKALVKPNLLSAKDNGLPCAHPAVVRAVCVYLLDHGCRVSVGDSPGFGTGVSVAEKIGLTEQLKGLDVSIIHLNRPRQQPLSHPQSRRETIGISQVALEHDLLVNVPKLKVHMQMRLTLAVKNCFGTVCGARKAWAHAKWGDKDTRFESMLHDVHAALPPMVSVLDGVVGMHKKGPMGGEPYSLGLIGASRSAIALDTALHALLMVTPEQSPIWQESLRRKLPGACLDDLRFPMRQLDEFDAGGFVVPGDDAMVPVTFNPFQLARSACKRALARMG